ncbi:MULTISPECIES: methyltransferase domain-containing protein [unclassified Streptosporangium]|uniref:methyltransferase domain-containing protein n=1 Tax=Streptosporangium sp. NPDC005286 TaxID=3154463 RepID=UPI0033B2B242
MTGNSGEIQACWLNWNDYSERILGLRRQVFATEQGWGEEMVNHERDPEGLHLGAMLNGEIIAVISAYLYEPGAPELSTLELQKVDGLTVQIGKRVELAEHRGRHISERIGTSMLRQICESLRPDRFFLLVRGQHRNLIDRYTRRNFVRHADIGSADDVRTVMTVEGEEAVEEFYFKNRALDKEPAPGGSLISVPSLVRFLVESGRGDVLAAERLGAENHYLEPLSIEAEMPRLTAQGRLMATEQRSRLASTPFPPAPASLLDIGTGPGEYLAAVAREESLAGYRVRGVEPSPQLLARARSSFPEITFREGTAYATGEADSSHDVITANFVFVHLRSPDLALLEMRRVLRPGGLLYVVDVNDDSFRGPDVIRRMIETHNRNYAGDRTFLTDLPGRAEQFGFEPVRRFSTTVRNTGGSRPAFGPDEIRIGRADAWGLLSFVRTQRGVEEVFKEAQDFYFGAECEMSLDIETQVYRSRPSPENGR